MLDQHCANLSNSFVVIKLSDSKIMSFGGNDNLIELEARESYPMALSTWLWLIFPELHAEPELTEKELISNFINAKSPGMSGEAINKVLLTLSTSLPKTIVCGLTSLIL